MIEGQVVIDRSTKQLVKRLQSQQIAWIHHRDLDLVAAQELRRKNVKAVINSQPFFSGAYPAKGALYLSQQDIPLFEVDSSSFDFVMEGEWIRISKQGVQLVGRKETDPIPHRRLKGVELWAQYQEAWRQSDRPLQMFITNTLTYARQEQGMLAKPRRYPPLLYQLKGRDALIVVRGEHYEADLHVLQSYIKACHPLIIGVDGGADAIMRAGFRPHFIVGDMDSVSEEALRTGAQLLVHAYHDGHAPGMARLEALGLDGQLLQLPGTSEDAAMLMAYDHGARQIITLGSHTHMVDFLEKGRAGMASTFLVRLRLGERLIDLKGISQLFAASPARIEMGWGMIGMVASSLSLLFSPHFRQLLSLFLIQFKLWLM